jgi:predicted MPP superfamily phosphohydrolase
VAKIKSPVYGVPGNHDYWSGSDFGTIAKCFTATGGEWLLNREVMAAGGKVCLHGATCLKGTLPKFSPSSSSKNILLIHYPIFADEVKGDRYDLILAGHSHGGQVRLPFYGALVLPYWVGKYDMGMFRLPAGPLYVNPGIGWMTTPMRFNCRPEITVFDI